MDNQRYYVNFSDEAKENYQQIKRYLVEDFGDNAFERFKEEILITLSLLAENPHLFQIFDKEKKIYRAVLRKQCSLFYEVREEEVLILSVFDNRKESPKFT